MSFCPDSLTGILSSLPFSLDWLPPQACLVGGAVRDGLLRRRRDYLDLDFVLPELAVETAKKIAHHYQAGFVVLDSKRQIARVVFPEGTVDFALQEGDTLTRDLQRRDFTVNAIAYSIHRSELIDPLAGLDDLKSCRLRMVCATNLEDDPLRLLRAYRQAAQLDFIIEPETRKAIQKRVDLLGKVAAERVLAELRYLLGHHSGNKWLAEAEKDGLLKYWLPTVTSEKIEQIAKIDHSFPWLFANIKENLTVAKPWLGKSTSKMVQMAKLACLVSPFPEIAESELINLKCARWEIRSVVIALKYLPKMQPEAPFMSLREQYFFFLDVGDIFPVLALLAIAVGGDRQKILTASHHYFNPEDKVAHPQPLVTGKDLLSYLQIKPSRTIGRLLTEVQIAAIEGKIATKEEALQLAKSLLKLY